MRSAPTAVAAIFLAAGICMPFATSAGDCKGTHRQAGAETIQVHTVVTNKNQSHSYSVKLLRAQDNERREWTLQPDESEEFKGGISENEGYAQWTIEFKDVSSGETFSCEYNVSSDPNGTQWERGLRNSAQSPCSEDAPVTCEKTWGNSNNRWTTRFTVTD
jgi:hypothetical protein